MTKSIFVAALLASAAVLGVQSASAYPVTVETVNSNGSAFDAVPNGITGGITGTFAYAGPLTFSNTAAQNSSSAGDLNSAFFSAGSITGFSCTSTPSCTLPAPSNANFSSLSTFLASSGSASGYQYGSLYSIDLGVISAGTVLSITHDDGASVYQGATRIGMTVAGPTTATTDTVELSKTADTMVWYARENGTPSVLTVAVPEPVSAVLLGSGLVLVGAIRRKNRAKA